MIVVINSGVSNLASVIFALQRIGVNAEVSTDPATVQRASHVILPGVGAASAAQQSLKREGLIDVLPRLTQPVLGICLGMQLMYVGTAEGEVTGLNIFPGRVGSLDVGNELPLPHMGWNTVTLTQPSPLFENVDSDCYVYFVHSYAAPLNAVTCATTTYGQTFTAIAQWKNFYATQFHPERSGVAGAQLLKNFINL